MLKEKTLENYRKLVKAGGRLHTASNGDDAVLMGAVALIFFQPEKAELIDFLTEEVLEKAELLFSLVPRLYVDKKSGEPKEAGDRERFTALFHEITGHYPEYRERIIRNVEEYRKFLALPWVKKNITGRKR